jgi:hypothetical protein
MEGTSLSATEALEAGSDWERLVNSRRGSVLAALSVGVITGCWIAYALLYPLSSLPLPRYTLVSVALLGGYIDYFARSMLDRIGILIGAVIVAFITAFVVYTLPASLGWHSDPILQRTLFISGLKQVSIFTLAALVLLIGGTLGAYILRNVYREFSY